MEQELKNRVIILGLGVLLVIFVAFFLLGNIWTESGSANNQNSNSVSSTNEVSVKEDETKILGRIYSVSNGQDKILKEYFSDIFKTLASSDEDEIYNITSKDYLEKYNLDKNKLYNKLRNKGLVGKAFECKKYAVADNPRFGMVYSLEISSIDGSIIDRIIVIEESPRNYKVSYDSYVGKVVQDIEIVKEGLKMEIASVEEYKDVVYLRMALENTTDDVLILNSGKNAAEAIYLNLTGDTKIYNTKDFFMSKEIELKPGQRISMDQEFFISDLQSSKINKLVIVNVYNTASQTKENYEYSVYN